MSAPQWWQVAREHVRAQRRYAVTMGALVTVALTLSALAGIAGASAHERDQLLASVTGFRYDNSANVGYYSEGDPAWHQEMGLSLYEPDQAREVLEKIATHADSYVMSRHAMVPHRDLEHVSGLWGADGEVPWDLIIYAGRAPHDGEIVLAGPLARQLGVGLGDTITFAGQARILITEPVAEPELIDRAVTFEVVGLARVDSLDLYYRMTPEGYVTFTDATRLQETFGLLSGRTEDGVETALIDTFVSWDGDVPVTLDPDDVWYSIASTPSYEYLVNGASGTVQYAGLLGLIIAGGVLVSALAMARNQAAKRTQWVATARALGARKAHLVGASLTEGALIAVVAVGVGLAVAWSAMAVYLAVQRSSSPEVYQIDAPSLPWWLVAGLAVMAVVLALAVSAAPALWAVRTSPVAALKPSPPAVETPLQLVKVRRGWVAVAVGFPVAVLLERIREPLGLDLNVAVMAAWSVPFVLACVGAVVVLVGVMQRLLRTAAARLEHRGAAWSHTAADMLRAKERHALVMAGGLAVATASVVTLVHQQLQATPVGFRSYPPEPKLPSLTQWWSTVVLDMGGYFGAVVLGSAATVLAVAVGWSTVTAMRSDAATRAALGLTRQSMAWARLAFQAVPTAVGVAVGVGVALVVTTVTHAVNAIGLGLYAYGFAWSLHLAGLTALSGLWTALIVSLIGALGACLVGFSAQERSPMEELTRSR